MSALDDFDFGEPVFRITRAQLIDDGRLADLTRLYPDLIDSAGITCHVAMTDTAFALAVAPIDDDTTHKAIESTHGPGEHHRDHVRRICSAYVQTVRRQSEKRRGNQIDFAVTVRAADGWREIDLKCIAGPGDDGETVLTFLLPNED